MFKNFDKNTILGALLIMLMVMLYFNYSKTQMEQRIQDEKIKKELKTAENNQSKISSNPMVLDSNPKGLKIDTTQTTTKGEDIELSNELLSIKINTKGAKIHNAVLKKHTTFENKPVVLLSDNKTNVDFAFPSPNGDIQTQNLVFQVVSKSNEKLELSSPNGINVTYSLTPNSYLISQQWYAQNSHSKKIIMKFSTEMNRQEANLSRERQYSSIKYLPINEDKASSVGSTKNETIDESNSLKWLSFGQQFFHISILPTNGFEKAIMSSEFKEDDQGYVKKYEVKSTLSSSSDTLALDYFVGPADYKMLKKLDRELDLIVPLSQDFILFRWMKIFNIYIIIPIFDFLSKYISNYGIIILLLTLFIKIITAPLSYKTYKSGVAMKILKPELDKLKAKFGDDQARMSQEQMKLYGDYGVSPFGGCFPMLLQMPILFAMFFFFPASIELRHQEFLWAKDLSTFDTFLTLPFNIPIYGAHVSLFALLTSLTQIGMSIYSQRLQPSNPQMDQMKIMTYMMPVIFLFMFNSFPAALTYYYFLQNILSMAQQWFFTTFIIKEDKVRAEMELAKKTPKKQGAFQKKMSEMMEQADQQRKMQQNQNKK